MRQFLFATITLLASAGCQTKNAGTISGGAFGSNFTEMSSSVGSSLDAQDKKVMEQSSPRTVDRMERGDPLTIGDIIKLHESGISDETVIRYIRLTKTSYDLNQTNIRRLQNTGVSQRIIDFMLETGR